jgi:hypothetical protein
MPTAYSMTPYMIQRPVERTFPLFMRSRGIRRAVAALPSSSRLRRALILRVGGWLYRSFNSSGQVPELILASDVTVEQSAAVFDSAGRFSGLVGFEAMLQEFRDAFDDFRFVPLTAIQLSPNRIYFTIRFEATGRGSSVQADRTIGHIVDLNGDLYVRHFSIYWDEPAALQAAGLSE